MKDLFIQAIQNFSKVRISFYSLEDRKILVRICAPLDFGPSRRAKEKNDRFHVWDYDSDKVTHVLSLNPEQVRKIELIDERFDPAEFVTWDTKRSTWLIKRNWGKYS